MLPRADADLALPFRLGEVFIGKARKIQVLLGVKHPRPLRQREPVAVLVAQVLGDGGGKRLGFDGLGQAAIDQIDQVADVHGHQHVGGRGLALLLDPLGQAVLEEDGIDLHPGRFGERGQQRLDQIRLARGVKVQFLGACGNRLRSKHGTDQSR